MELARQSPQLIGGLPEPMVQAINRNDTEELQRIFRCITCAGPCTHSVARLCGTDSLQLVGAVGLGEGCVTWHVQAAHKGCGLSEGTVPLCRQIQAHRQAEAKERQAEMELLSADPFDPEVQAKIAERIRQAQVEENYQTAYEYMPESFSQVTMLYVDMEVRPPCLLPQAS